MKRVLLLLLLLSGMVHAQNPVITTIKGNKDTVHNSTAGIISVSPAMNLIDNIVLTDTTILISELPTKSVTDEMLLYNTDLITPVIIDRQDAPIPAQD